MAEASNNPDALITGTGIGYELAKLFAQDGYNVIAVARTRYSEQPDMPVPDSLPAEQTRKQSEKSEKK